MNVSSKKIIPYYELWKNLSFKRKRQIILVLLINLISALTTSLSISSVIPFINSLNRSSNDYSFIFWTKIFQKFNNNYTNNYLIISLLLFTLSILIAGVFRILNLWVNSRYACSITCDLSTKAVGNFISMNYEDIITQNSNEFISTINIEGLEIRKVYTNIFTMLTNTFLIISIIITLYFVDNFITSFTLISIIIFYFLIGLILKRRLLENGSRVVSYNRSKTRILQEILGLIEFILLKSKQDIFLKDFFDKTRMQGIVTSRFVLYSAAPKFILESISIIFFSIVIFISLKSSNNEMSNDIFPKLASFALGAQKLLPLCSQLFTSWSVLENRTSSTNSLLDILNNKSKVYKTNTKSKNIFRQTTSNELLTLEDVSFAYGDSKKNILKNINLSIFKGEKLGIIGETGSGKSSLLSILIGLIIPSSGSVKYRNKDIHLIENKNLLRNWKEMISLVPQSIFLINDSIKKNITFGQHDNQINDSQLDEVLFKSSLNKLIKNSKNGILTKVGERGIKLSGGEIQRIGIARALYTNPKVLFLDEATSAVDNLIESKIINQIHSQKKELTIVMVAHRLSTLKYCDRIIELENGVIKKIYSNTEFNEKYLN